MKKFIIIITILVGIYLAYDFTVYHLGWYIDFNPNKKVEVIATTEEKNILINNSEFEIKGVNIGASIPGEFITDFAISKETYLNWFDLISKMGANTIKIYTIYNPEFYEAFYEFNSQSEKPLYLIQGIWINDYIKNSRKDAYDDEFRLKLFSDIRTTIDVVYGKRKVFLGKTIGSGSYKKDISNWVLGYLIGDEWEDTTIAYTDDLKANNSSYQGKFIKTTESASAYEVFLAEACDVLISYETTKYKNQRLISFVSSAETDPFEYSEEVSRYFKKIAKLDIENLKVTDEYKSGLFASYSIYPYFSEYLSLNEDIQNTDKFYLEYLKTLNNYHTIPMVITEFGYTSSRGMAGDQIGGMNETEQAKKIVAAYNDIKTSGTSGAFISTWQDEWHRKTWNTIEKVDVTRTPYWSDYQVSGQSYGILTFDPGEKNSISYVDGEIKEWTEKNKYAENNNLEIYSKYDEKFIYFMVKGYDKENEVYIPIDTTQKSGAKTLEGVNVDFDRNADFLIILDGINNSKILVQERYEVLRAMNLVDIENRNPYINTPEINSPIFKEINMLLKSGRMLNNTWVEASIYETGKLVHGIANPVSNEFNSLADFYIKDDIVEIKIPWEILNFSDPSQMQVHDDYYLNYGVENILVNRIYFGVGLNGSYINMGAMSLKPWRNKVKYHERLKVAYYEIQKNWKEVSN